MRKNEIRKMIRKEVSKILKENSVSKKSVEKARKGIENNIIPVLERLVGELKLNDPEMSDWAKSILEDQKDVYEELSDLESEIAIEDHDKRSFY